MSGRKTRPRKDGAERVGVRAEWSGRLHITVPRAWKQASSPLAVAAPTPSTAVKRGWINPRLSGTIVVSACLMVR